MSIVEASAQNMTVVSWNAESGGANPDTIANHANPDTIANHMNLHFGAIDIWGISEVSASWAPTLEAAAEAAGGVDYGSVLGTTGGADRLLILYNDERFDLTGTEELEDINIGGYVRAPLVATLLDNESGAQFSVMMNHLYRTNEGARHQQSTMLNQWATTTDATVIALGDYNYDWETVGGDADHDLGYDNLVADGVFEWVRPSTLARTQCSKRTRSDGTVYCRYDSVLDFVFVAGGAQDWQATGSIVTWEDDFPDDHLHPDHRPVSATFVLGGGAPPTIDPALRLQILERLDALEQEIQALRALLGGDNG
jgi:hypothetical protein